MDTATAKSAAVQFYAVAIGPIAAAVDMGLSYATVYHACSTGHHYVLHVISVVCVLFALSGAYVGWREYQTVREYSDDGGHPLDRTHFLALMGVVASIGFALVIVALAVPKFILSPCD
ncbi:MAG TPA: hypothetical protein VN577_13980 [Terriglobales bacterium]|nr:hypothetical protein [Terriglobales bacterium]